MYDENNFIKVEEATTVIHNGEIMDKYSREVYLSKSSWTDINRGACAVGVRDIGPPPSFLYVAFAQ